LAHHPKFIEAVRLFNEHKFWEAHEALEVLWLADKSPDRAFFQGLIHCAAALHHLRLATMRREGRHGEHPATDAQVLRHLEGARGQWAKAGLRLGPFRPRHGGIGVDALVDGMARALDGLDEGRAVFRPGNVPELRLED